MKSFTLLLLGLPVGLIAWSGCGSVNMVGNAHPQGQTYVIADRRVITDAELNREVNVVAINTSMTPGGLLKVQVELRNHTDSEQRYLYHFEWFDASGMQVNNVLSASIPDQIEGKEDKFISGIAPSPECRDFRVKFLDAN